MTEAFPAVEAAPLVLTEIQDGQGLALSAVGRLFPAHRGAGTVDPSTVFRWMKKGAKSSDGRVARLEAVRVGGRWLTSRSAIGRFVKALTASGTAPTVPGADPTRTASARQRATGRAARELEKRGA